MPNDDDIIDFDEEFRNLTEDEVSRIIELEWTEQQARRANPKGLTSKIIEEYEDWYEGDVARKEFLYQKVIQLNETAEGHESAENRSAFINKLKREVAGEVFAKRQIPKSVLQSEQEQEQEQAENHRVPVVDALRALDPSELLTYKGVLDLLGGQESASIQTRVLTEDSLSRTNLFESLRKLESYGLLHSRRINGTEIFVHVKKRLVQEALPEITKLMSS